MRTKAIIVSLIMGVSTVAMARPAAPIVRDHRADPPGQTTTYRDRELPAADWVIEQDGRPDRTRRIEGRWFDERDDIRHAPRSSWEAITGTAQLRRGTQTFTNFDYAGGMSRLRVDLMSGTANIRALTIRFANGQSQTVSVGRLASSNAAFDIDLTSRARIQSITVTGRGDGSYRLLGV